MIGHVLKTLYIVWYSPQQFTFLLMFSRTRHIFSFIFLSMHCPESSKEAAQVSWHNLSDQKSETRMTRVAEEKLFKTSPHWSNKLLHTVLFCAFENIMSRAGVVCIPHTEEIRSKIVKL